MPEAKSVTTTLTLFDDRSTREKYTAMEKFEIMADDSRNPELEFWCYLDDFLVWGKTYKLTIEEVEK